MINRRTFIKSGTIVSAGALALRGRTWPFLQGPAKIRKFITSLPGLGPSGKNEIGQYIPLATKNTMNFAGLTTDVYSLAVGKFSERMHPDLPGSTDFLGYFDLSTVDQKYLGGIIVAKRNTPVILKVENRVPNRPIIPVDHTVMAGPGLMVGDLPYNRIVTHLHGGLIPWFSDGTPFQWYTPEGQHGASFLNVPGFPAPPAGTAVYYYPNQQSARLVWYHDHAIGITRTNAYAGIASGYIITDDFEVNMVNLGLLPDLVGIPLIIQDKGFVPIDIDKQDPAWKWGKPGDLWYPHDYEANILSGGVRNRKGRWDWGPTSVPPAKGTLALPAVSLVPETFFDTTLVNGGLYPKISVPPKRMRFRILNGSQARFYHMNLYAEDPSNAGEANLKKPGPVMYQTGTEGGFLPAVAVHYNKTPIPLLPPGKDPNMANPDGPFNLLLAPGERADVVIDFNGVPAGSSFILYNDAPAPFPCGDPRNDYFTGDSDQTAIGGAPTTQLGSGPNSRTLMKFVVTAGVGDSIASPTWLANLNVKLRTNFLNGNQPGLLYHGGDPSAPGPLPYTGPVDRKLTLCEEFDDRGRLIQFIGTFTPNGVNNQGRPTWGRAYMAPTTENPSAGSVEVWQIMNLTSDTHPMHFHLVNVQMIQRQPFKGNPSKWSYSGPPTAPDVNEIGWKETLRMKPGEVTTVIMQFDLPNLPTAGMKNAVSPRTGGHEYVWHCHILEHEEHDMMRPLIVS